MKPPRLLLTSPVFAQTIRWAIVLTLWVLLISMASGQAGISNYRELVKNRDELAQLNIEVALKNQTLEEEMIALKTSRDVQIRYLKDNFGYIELGETVYRFDHGPLQRVRMKKRSSQPGITAQNKKDGKI